jgi:hypothetical protein
MTRFHAILAVGLICVAPCAGMAQDRPIYLPTHDVTVTYSFSAGGKAAGAPDSVRVAVAAGGERARIEPEGAPGYMVIDRADKQVMMIMTAQRMFMAMPGAMDQVSDYLPNDQMHFTRTGSETVAGYRCTDWTVTGKKGDASGCITDDGVLLRGQAKTRDGTAHLLATQVSYGALPDSLFRPPAGFQKLEIPVGALLHQH